MSLIELESAEALLDMGVSVPFSEVRVPFTGKFIRLRVTMRRPRLGNRIRIARNYLKLGVTAEQVEAFTTEQEMEFLSKHGRRLSKMVALTICRGYFSSRLLSPIVAFVVRWFVQDKFLLGAQRTFISLLGTKSFTTIIRSVQMTNPMAPRLSH